MEGKNRKKKNNHAIKAYFHFLYIYYCQVIHEGSDGGLLGSRLGQGASALHLSNLYQHIHGEGEKDHRDYTASYDPFLELVPVRCYAPDVTLSLKFP